MCVNVYVCVHVSSCVCEAGNIVLCMYICRCLGSVCGSLAFGLASGGGCEGVNKENEEVLQFIDVFQIQIQGSQNA